MADFRDTTLPLEERVTALLAALTPDEKMSLCAGRNFWETKPVPRLGLRPFKLSDGPRGVAFHSARRRGTSFPSGIALGASFDLDLSRRMGEALGREAREAGCGVILGPAVNLCRTPLNGRTFEYFSEDPHLNARLTVPYVQGVQSQKVAACVKHYAANNQETNRMRHDVVVSRRALRELYLPAFEAAVREGEAWSVMAAYNAVNGIAACQHEELLNDVLRDEWGFTGFVVSDWFAGRRTDSAAACLRGGLSLDMPGRGTRYRWGRMRKEFAAGEFDEVDLDRALRGLLRIMFRTGHIDEPPRPRPWRISTPEHQVVARELAEAGMTLLRNEGGLLPLDPERVRTLAVLGPRADTRHCLPLWGGSSGVWPPHEVTPRQGLEAVLRGKIRIVDVAAEADAAVVFVGLTHRPGQDSEARDRSNLALPPLQEALLRRTLAENRNTIVVVVAGSPIAMDWADRAAAILYAWYPGMEGGHAIANVLTGRVNPSGKLPVTFPKRLAHSPAHRAPRSFPGDRETVHYDEDVFVGYRHFDRAGIDPLFCFGHGLSYTYFAYSEFALETERFEGEGTLVATVRLTNTGARDGAEVAQLYLEPPPGPLPRPVRTLVAFEKRFLRAGESARLRFELSSRSFACFDEARAGWRVDAGRYGLAVGASSRDLRERASLEVVKDGFEPVGA